MTHTTSPPTSPAAPATLPRIAVLATGGTIAGAAPDATNTAGYQAGALGLASLLDAVPALTRVAQIEGEQVASIDSKDLEPALWATLVQRIEALAADPRIDGIVITHGTDTLEETAALLHLCVATPKPVVITAAMRPATALSPDGPLNLLNAVTVAASAAARGRGVLVAFNNKIHAARDVVKTSTYAVDAFQSPETGVLGWVQDGRVEFARGIVRDAASAPRFSIGAWPAVEIVSSYAGASRIGVDALVAAGVKGIVVAGTGNGSIHATLQAALQEAARRGVAVVRASRVGSGHVMRNGAANDEALGFVSAGSLNPFKARVLLMLALAAGIDDAARLQAAFDTY
ncbi:asparaginase [Burkholderia gladioli]|uniref:asparaginase n=1 Tax=Burkholderia gladioli TaxID=28095 RepID=UPI000BBD177F|nr:asparaginase [Burkholderia gladioli]ATF83986.1 L-asparaginase [Burkholderia gladioli pv. gladioli]MBJ9663117.1 asparaginase [Burkholderia gladioli]MBJ9709958.1 asparaginase [Burkholderia gladioli]MBU9153894.1 asparaginase [Burkholderia gladioli]MBU9212848.1 asparaginase [Burkholderia gladioli]